MSIGSFKHEAGLNHVGAYQVSGTPFASGSIDAITTQVMLLRLGSHPSEYKVLIISQLARVQRPSQLRQNA